MEKTIEDLKNIGFWYVGYWIKNDKDKLNYQINKEDLIKENLLYAFESDSIVRYIGITENTLKNRMSLYKSGHNEKSSGSTNKKVYKQIKELLENKKDVNIYILKDVAPCTFGGYEISLATGIEKSLIKAFDFKKSLWNKRGVKNETPERPKNKINSKNVIVMEKDCINGIYIKKKASESNLKGKINLGKIPVESLPNFGDIVNIYLDGEEVFQANFINAQQGRCNPMINSATIGNWLIANGIEVGNNFYIKIGNNNSFYFYINNIL